MNIKKKLTENDTVKNYFVSFTFALLLWQQFIYLFSNLLVSPASVDFYSLKVTTFYKRVKKKINLTSLGKSLDNFLQCKNNYFICWTKKFYVNI